MNKLYDKTGREMQIGDVLKVFQFTGARRKKHYVYKQLLGYTKFGVPLTTYGRFGHLNLVDDEDQYLVLADGRHMPEYEIVQSVDCDFENRERKTP